MTGSYNTETVKRKFDVAMRAFGARCLAYQSGNLTQELNADIYSKKGWLWRTTGKHVFSVNDTGSLSDGRMLVIEKMMQGIYPCDLPECHYCEPDY